MSRSAAADSRLLLEPRFLSLHECAVLRRAMDAGAAEPADVVGREIVHRDRIRRTRSIEIETPLCQWFERRLDRLRPRLMQRLQRRLHAREGAGFLRYPAGGFYRPHRDRGTVAGWPAAARRAVSVVVFLNCSRQAQASGDFDGGALRLYLEPNGRGVEVHPESGLLVAFPSEILHEVEIVRGGVRDAAVDWFYDA